jgi:AbrB family looped-hinge helix DNA binding protein
VIEMAKIKVSSKGQIVIPKNAREELGINSGQELDCIVQEGKIIITPHQKQNKTRKISELFGILDKFGKDKPVSIEDMDNALATMFRNDPQWGKTK